MGRNVWTGFDSAWTRKNRGAIVSLIFEDGRYELNGPHLVSFEEALAHLQLVGTGAELHAIAIDQPLIVNNDASCRPVDRVVSHVMGSHGSGVQPANRGKESMFGNSAPIWPFLAALKALGFCHHNNADQRGAVRGRFFFEVYPALGNLGLFPPFYARGVVARYNPANRTFTLGDWQLLCDHIVSFFQERNLPCEWLRAVKDLARPRKHDQDKLDALICLCHALCWTSGGEAVVVGDLTSGYMVVPSHDKLTASLRKHAQTHGVEFWAAAT